MNVIIDPLTIHCKRIQLSMPGSSMKVQYMIYNITRQKAKLFIKYEDVRITQLIQHHIITSALDKENAKLYILVGKYDDAAVSLQNFSFVFRYTYWGPGDTPFDTMFMITIDLRSGSFTSDELRKELCKSPLWKLYVADGTLHVVRRFG